MLQTYYSSRLHITSPTKAGLLYTGICGDVYNLARTSCWLAENFGRAPGFTGRKSLPPRAAFSNEVEYDLSVASIIGYKEAKLEVVEATNEYIKYRVISNFRSDNDFEQPEPADSERGPQKSALKNGRIILGFIYQSARNIDEASNVKNSFHGLDYLGIFRLHL